MNVQPGASFEAVLDSGTPGLSTVGAEINDNLGTIYVSFSAASTEMAPGVYTILFTSPTLVGQYSIVWRDGNGGPVIGVEDLTVTGQPSAPIGTPPPIPPSPGGLTYKQIQDECVNFRFGEGRRNSVKYWINRRYQAVWGEAEWPFKRVNRQPVTTANGQILMPVGFRRAVAFEDADGGILQYIDPETFRFDNPTTAAVGGTASEYTVWGGQILVNTVVEDGQQFFLSYLRRICVLDKDGFLVEGLLTNDGDRPLWDPEHHYLLVLGATSTGLKLENDFTWQSLEEEFNAAIIEMKDDLLPPDTVGTTQYGADDLF